MSVICQHNQYGHCKFGSKCDKFHTIATCDHFPCLDSECNMRHPRLCKYFSAYGRCMFADKCSFLHSFTSGHHHTASTASNGVQEIMQAVAEMREEVKALRLEVDMLGDMNKNLMEKLKDLKEEVDVDRVMRLRKDSMVSQEHIKPGVDRDMTVQCEGLFAACKHGDVEAVKAALDGIAIILAMPEESSGVGTILEECGGLHRIELLKWHSHEVIRRKAVQILEWLSGPDDVQNMHEENVYEQNGYEEDGFEENGYKQNLDKQNEHTGGRRGRKKRKGAGTGNIRPGRGRKNSSL